MLCWSSLSIPGGLLWMWTNLTWRIQRAWKLHFLPTFCFAYLQFRDFQENVAVCKPCKVTYMSWYPKWMLSSPEGLGEMADAPAQHLEHNLSKNVSKSCKGWDTRMIHLSNPIRFARVLHHHGYRHGQLDARRPPNLVRWAKELRSEATCVKKRRLFRPRFHWKKHGQPLATALVNIETADMHLVEIMWWKHSAYFISTQDGDRFIISIEHNFSVMLFSYTSG